jgi:hypothetical protein
LNHVIQKEVVALAIASTAAAFGDSRLIRFSSSAGRAWNSLKMALAPALLLPTAANFVMALCEILGIMLLVHACGCCCRCRVVVLVVAVGPRGMRHGSLLIAFQTAHDTGIRCISAVLGKVLWVKHRQLLYTRLFLLYCRGKVLGGVLIVEYA